MKSIVDPKRPDYFQAREAEKQANRLNPTPYASYERPASLQRPTVVLRAFNA